MYSEIFSGMELKSLNELHAVVSDGIISINDAARFTSFIYHIPAFLQEKIYNGKFH